MIERTLSIVKPDGVAQNVVGEVVRRFESAGLRVVALSPPTPCATRIEVAQCSDAPTVRMRIPGENSFKHKLCFTIGIYGLLAVIFHDW